MPEPNGRDGLIDQTAMAAVYEAATTGERVAVAGDDRTERNQEQE